MMTALPFSSGGVLAGVVDFVATHWMVSAAFRVLALALLAAAVTGTAAFIYRARTHQQFPEGPTVLIGLGAVGLALNTRLVFVQFLGENGDILTISEAGLNIAVFVAAGVAAYGGRRAGDQLATAERLSGRLQPDFSPLVRATGRIITVSLPEDPDDIHDIEGYDPVSTETKSALAGTKLDFPRGLTLVSLETQLAARLREEYTVGSVDVDLTEDGTIEYLAVGQHAAGLGPTLPPKSAAVSLRADPPFSATAGDTVQVWRVTEDAPERLGPAELRASVGGVVTVVTDESLARQVDPTAEYRLLTLPTDSHPDREFAAMLRREAETMSVVSLSAESPLVGSPVGALDVTLIAIRDETDEIDTIPKRDRVLRAGDHLFAIGRPDALRRLEGARGATPTAVAVSPVTGISLEESVSES